MVRSEGVSGAPWSSRVTDLFGCAVPMQLAPMGGVVTPALAVAVADSGGMAMLAGVMVPPATLQATVRAVQEQTAGPVGVNFLLLMPPDHEAIEVAATTTRYVDFYHGPIDPGLVQRVHRDGALAGWQLNSVEEARRAADAGCDVVVVRGAEGGGRMDGDQPLRPLLEQVVAAVDVPVVAAGGIATGDDIASCMAAGADAVRLGTRYVATAESGAHPAWIEAIVRAGPGDAVLTDRFSEGLPSAGRAGVLRAALEAAAEMPPDAVVGHTLLGGREVPVRRFSPLPPTRDTHGKVEAMAMYAGTSAASIADVPSAGDLTRRLWADAVAAGS